MSVVPRDLLRQLQTDCEGRILAAPWLSTVAVIREERAVTEQEIQKQLGSAKGRGGKVGACILVQRVLATPVPDDTAGRAQLVQAFTVLEHPSINAQSNGTGKTAEEIALELFDLFHLAACALRGQVFSGFPGGAIVPDNSFAGLNGWEVRFQIVAGLRRTERCGPPLIAPDEGAAPLEITLTTATAGAEIYYTTDGSYPSSANTAATLYTAPFTLAEACTLRAAAEKAGLQQSSISEATFSET